MRKTWIMFLAVSMSGCAAFHNLTSEQIRQQQYFYREAVVHKSIPEIAKAAYDYTGKCRPIPTLNIDPSQKVRASMTLTSIGLTKPSVVGVIDFQQVDKHETKVEIYSYYTTWRSQIDRVIEALEHPDICKA